jgi:hypothetical protein
LELETGKDRDKTHFGEQSTRIKSSNRMRYDAEVQFLIRQNGTLETVRQRLGLSKRKICQLLLVDPSAWTRWTSPQGSAPPHIYRALDWYLAMMEKDPEYRRLATRFTAWLNQEKAYEGRLASLEGLLARKSIGLKGPTEKRHKLLIAGAFIAGLLCALLLVRAHLF